MGRMTESPAEARTVSYAPQRPTQPAVLLAMMAADHRHHRHQPLPLPLPLRLPLRLRLPLLVPDA